MGLSFEFGRRNPDFGVDHTSPAIAPSYDAAHDPQFQAALSLRRAGQLARAGVEFDRMAEEARRVGDASKEARMLLSKAGVQLRQFEYRDADRTYQELLKLSGSAGDTAMSGAAMVNLAEIHTQLSDLPAAEREAQSAVNLLKQRARSTNLVRAELQLGSIQAAQGETQSADRAYRAAIEQASNLSDLKTEAFAWLIYGQAQSQGQHYAAAEHSYLTAYRLAWVSRDPLLDTIRAKLAELYSFQGRPAEGLELLDAVLKVRTPEQLGFAEHQVLLNRAQMLAATGRREEALKMYRAAVAAATHWRQEALPGEVANAGSVQTIHNVYAEASDFLADLALTEHRPEYARESLEILATNRAADLREARTLAWHRDGRLPPRYYQLLSQLRGQEANVILDPGHKQEIENGVRQTRADLAILETQIALDSEKSVASGERFGPRKTLKDIQHSLSDDDALFTFNLGKRRSWLWAVSNQTVSLCKLASADALERESSVWAAGVRSGTADVASGAHLAEVLFSQVPRHLFEKRNWLVVNDRTLFINVPVSALPDLRGTRAMTGGRAVEPLIANHTVRYLSSEYSLRQPAPTSSQSFLFAGVGDPIYNIADTRYEKPKLGSFRKISYGSTALARLVGSGREVRESAAEFSKAEVLTGQSARTESLQNLLEANPTVIHLAVHVVSPPERPEEAALALSLGRDSLPELLTPELVATYHVPGSLVVMSGCDSQQGKAVPGVGVKGLSRAWLLAGASAVVASTWPMPDEDGKFFRSFYRHFISDSQRAQSVSQLAAAALADAQNDMRASQGFRHDAAFWAAYSVISKE